MEVRAPSPRDFSRRPQRGSVILFVLGVVLLTAFLLTRLIDRAGTELMAENKAASRASSRDEAYSALEVTLAVLADVAANDNGLHSPQQGWGDPLAYASYEPAPGFDTTVTFEDETGKLPLASVSEQVLQLYLETIGATNIEAERLTDALLVWTRKDHVAGSSEADPHAYENSPLPYAPPQRQLLSFEELRAVAVVRELFFDPDGRWTALGDRFRTDASLFPFNQVNVNSARPSVLVALGLDTSQAAAIADDNTAAADPKRPPQFYRTVADAAAVHGGASLTQAGLGSDVLCLRIRVTVRQGGRVFSVEAVIQPGNGGGASAKSVTGDADAATATDPNAEPTTPVDARALTRKSIDYPFRILELREIDGTAQ